MRHAQRRTLFLTGAPTSSSLQWAEADLTAALQPCYLNTQTVAEGTALTADDIAPSWHSLTFEQAHLPTGFTQASREEEIPAFDSHPTSEASFFSTSDLSFVSTDVDRNDSGERSGSVPDDSTDEILTQFYEHSFAVHDNVPSSQIISIGSMAETSLSTEADESSLGLNANERLSSQEQNVRSRLSSEYYCDINAIPNAAYILSITPQTMTINLVVGIISLSQPRTIMTRKSGRIVELVEMLVGDETRAGFSINIWLPCRQESKYLIQEAADLRSSTSQLRPQDIVVVRNVALGSFRGKVHGQSLRKGITTVDLLYRNTIDLEDTRGVFQASDLEQEALMNPQVLKVKKVKDWVMQFIGTYTRRPAPEERHLTHLRKQTLQPLPADSQ